MVLHDFKAMFFLIMFSDPFTMFLSPPFLYKQPTHTTKETEHKPSFCKFLCIGGQLYSPNDLNLAQKADQLESGTQLKQLK